MAGQRGVMCNIPQIRETIRKGSSVDLSKYVFRSKDIKSFANKT